MLISSKAILDFPKGSHDLDFLLVSPEFPKKTPFFLFLLTSNCYKSFSQWLILVLDEQIAGV